LQRDSGVEMIWRRGPESGETQKQRQNWLRRGYG
jgi:hypothetical protein